MNLLPHATKLNRIQYRMLRTKSEQNGFATTCYELGRRVSIWRSFVSEYDCRFMTRMGTKLRVGIVMHTDEWKSRCKLGPSGGKLHLQHLPISDKSNWASIIKFWHEVFEKVCPHIIIFRHWVLWISRNIITHPNSQGRISGCLKDTVNGVVQ